MSSLDEIRDAIEVKTSSRPVGPPQQIGGGCINEAFRLGDFFVKTNAPDQVDSFEAEALALEVLHQNNTVRVPHPICTGTSSTKAFLVLDYLPLRRQTSRSQATLGHQLALLHRSTSDRFGWSHDNFIGATHQPNKWTASWIDFLREQRLGPMLRLAEDCGSRIHRADTLLDNLDHFFETMPAPSLLHGDLWGGNAGALEDGTPVIFDPASHYGDREADLAMTHLFGGFSPAFYAAYEETWPLPPGHELRRDLYNLYHILNHAVLFGGSYGQQAQGMIDDLSARLGV